MKNVLIVLTAIITSLFFFPIEFTFLRGTNTKMMLAVLGLFIFVWRGVNNRKGVVVSKEFFAASMLASVFSLIVFYAVIYNNTNDYSYASYVVSMWVWYFAAYAVCDMMVQLHGNISVRLIINYLIGVCVAQCIVALMIDNIPSVKFFVDSFMVINAEWMDTINRLYGIGAHLDVAGSRFSAVLVMIAVLLSHNEDVRANKKAIAIYVLWFIVIAVIGSMVARTTNVGIIIAFGYIIYASGLFRIRIKRSNLKMWGVLISVTLFLIVACVYFYNQVPTARRLLRFAFEGLIYWIETGVWRTDSTDELQSMWVYPETFKTWIIGDGYFMNPTKPGFYMGTDVGFLRFIFYCGLIGLSAFSIFFMYISAACYKRFPQERNLFLLLLILVFVIWAKVSTDIFLVYALFMCIPMVQRHTNNHLTNRL